MIEVFANSLLIGYSGAVMPGSLLTYTIDKSIKKGAKSGLIISLGHSLLELLVVVLIFVGVGSYLATETAQMIIGFIGGIVLGFLGITMLRDAYLNKVGINLPSTQAAKGGGNMLVAGAVISASNPYFAFWWAAVGLGLILAAYRSFGLAGVILFYTGHIMADITWYCFISFLISRTRRFISQHVYRVIIVVLGLCLVGFGVRFLAYSLGMLGVIAL